MTSIARRCLLVSLGLACLPVWALADAVGQAARPFSAFTTDWQTIRAADMRGKVVVLTFWARWSPASIEQLSRLADYVRRHPDAPLLVLAAQAVDDSRHYGGAAFPLPYPSIQHLNGDGYGLIGGRAPSIYVIDQAGVLRYAAASALTDQGLEQAITPLLSASVPVNVTSTEPSTRFQGWGPSMGVGGAADLRPNMPNFIARPIRH